MRISGSDIRLLKVFDAVVRHGDFAAAQAELGVGASTISNHITALEQRLKVSLCQRGRGGFKLSDKSAGLIYRPLNRETHSLYCGAAHLLFDVGQDQMNLEDLLKESVAGRGFWRDSHHAELGFQNIKAVVYEIGPQLILIRNGKFIGYLPDHFAQYWVQNGALRCLSPVAPSFDCGFDLVI